MLANFRQDLKISVRQLRAKPGFALLAAGILALGIGSSTAVFSVLYQALLKPLAYPDAQQLVVIHNALPKSQVSETGVSGFDYAEIRARKDVFASSAVMYWNDLTLTGFGPARHIDVVNASASFFDVLAVPPQLGRVFTEAEDRAGAPKTAVLSDAFWRTTFSADPQVAGRVFKLNGIPYTVLGVMPAAFDYPSRETQMWIPTALRASEATIQGGRSEKWLHMVARLAPGVSHERADAALQTIADGLGSRFPALYPRKDGWRFTAHPLAEEQTAGIRRWLYVAFGAVVSVLLIACINVGGLLLIRADSRESEFAVRLAMGASRGRIVQQILTETGVLVLGGCLLGALFAVWAVHLINRYAPLAQPTGFAIWTLLFGFGIALLSSVAAGLLPAFWSAQVPLEQALRRGGTRTATAGSFWRSGIVAVQIALAVILTFTAAALSRSFVSLTRVPAGFDDARVWSGSIELPAHAYAADHSGNSKFFEPLLAKLQAIPGVERASGGPLPFNPSGIWTAPLQLGPQKQALHPESQLGVAFPGYFEAMRIPLLRGRTFTAADRAQSQKVAVIDEELARRYFAGEDPVGKSIGSGGMNTPARIVGVVGSVKNASLADDREPEVYYPEFQEPSDAMYLVLRTRNDADPSAAVRKAIAELNSEIALFDVEWMHARIEHSLNLRRFIAALLNGFALVGMLLAAVGLYASIAHLVALRRREIGIRVALGAVQSQVVRLVLASGAVTIAGGFAAGIAGSIVAGRAIRQQLYGVELTDAATWGIVGGIVLAFAAGALWLPARSAAQIEPSLALREE